MRGIPSAPKRWPHGCSPSRRSSFLCGALLALSLPTGCRSAQGISDELPTPDLTSPVDLLAPPDLLPAPPMVDPTLQWNALWLQRGARDFGGWTYSGAAVRGSDVTLAPSKGTPLRCSSEDIDGGVASYDATSGLCAGTEPMVAGLPADLKYYSGGPFLFGTMVSPEVPVAQPIDHLIASWNADTPAGTWLQVHVRARISDGPTAGSWTRWYSLPIWAGDFSTVKRHSVNGSADASGGIDTDTFFLKGGLTASAYQLAFTLFATSADKTPTVKLVAAVASKDMKAYATQAPDSSVWGTDLPVPQRSQELPEYKGKGYGGGGEVWCSPTSTSMVMAYWSQVLAKPMLTQTVPDAAAGTYDAVYDGTGNWPFNTAYAATYGLTGWITRLSNLSQAEAWIKAGVPLVISIGFKAGELPGAPISKTNGHLIVLRGFDKSGDPIVNDPAAKTDAMVHLTYPRAALENAWAHSHRTAYVMFPEGRAVPSN